MKRWIREFFAPDHDRVAHVPAIDAYLPPVDGVELAEARQRAHEALPFIAQAVATADESVFDTAPEPTKVTDAPAGPTYRIRRSGGEA